MRTPQYNRRRRGGRVAFAGYAMYAMCVVLLFSCLVVLSGCGLMPNQRPYVTVPGPLPTATSGLSQPVTLQDIHMFDEQNGWAVTQDRRVLHTTSGPEQWREASPSTGGLKYTPGVHAFLDAQNAWLVAQAGDKFSIFHTYNGGGLWLETPLLDAGSGVSQISSADARHGWLLFNKGSDARNQAVDIFQTTDGGNTWLLINGVDEKTGDLQGALPFAGRKTGISFRSASTGWITGSVMDSKNPLLYMTTDGGFTWMSQTLALPSGVTSAITTFAPTFVNANDGILPVTFTADGNKVDTYSTHDGGKTWSAGSPTADIGATVSFGSANQGWAAGGNGNADKVYTTSDAGRSWRPLAKPDANVTKLVSLDFISATAGWVLASTSDNAVRLFQTTNDGKSWTRLSPSAST